jgi:hypothetical protein
MTQTLTEDAGQHGVTHSLHLRGDVNPCIYHIRSIA